MGARGRIGALALAIVVTTGVAGCAAGSPGPTASAGATGAAGAIGATGAAGATGATGAAAAAAEAVWAFEERPATAEEARAFPGGLPLAVARWVDGTTLEVTRLDSPGCRSIPTRTAFAPPGSYEIEFTISPLPEGVEACDANLGLVVTTFSAVPAPSGPASLTLRGGPYVAEAVIELP